MEFRLEVIAFTIDSCLTIQESGAHRIELCANPAEGGTTPSYGMIRRARDLVSVDLFPIIRPRGGDFLYSEEEYEVMKQDILLCRQLGCNGVVIGMLNEDGSVDKVRVQQLVDMAYPMQVTFHRAFDRVSNTTQALEDVITCGCTRVLTSGQYPTVAEGKDVLRQLVQQAGDRIIIMPGSGLRASNIAEIAAYTGAREFHTSASTSRYSNMAYTRASMKEELVHIVVGAEEITNCLRQLQQIHQ